MSYPEPPPLPEAPTSPRKRLRGGWIVVAVLMAGAGAGGYAVVQAISTVSAASYASTTPSGGTAVQAATSTPTASPSHSGKCPNMGGSSSSSGTTAFFGG